MSDYQPGLASLFAATAREAPKIIIRAYCPVCGAQTEQVFARDEGKYEVYVCQRCGQDHKIAVR